MKPTLLFLFFVLTPILFAQTFTEVPQTNPFEGVFYSSVAFADVDGDNDQDVLLTGLNNSPAAISILYANGGIATSVDDLESGAGFYGTLFPNPPTANTLYLRYTARESAEVTIRIYNVNGVLLSRQNELAVIGPQQFSIDITSLPAGSYLLQIDNGSGKDTAKFSVR
jgi:hypothetical protein